MTLLLIALGGAAGALLRYGVARWLQAAGGAFPTATLVVNVSGSLLMGFLVTFFLERTHVPVALRLGLTVGVLGAYTTFSTFSIETLDLLRGGALGYAALNIVASVVAALLAVWAGQALARA